MTRCVLCTREGHVLDATGHCPACAKGISDARSSLIPERLEWPHRQEADGRGGCVLDGFAWPCPQARAMNPNIDAEYAEILAVIAAPPPAPNADAVRASMAEARAKTHRQGTNVSSHAKAKAPREGASRRIGPGPKPPPRRRPN